MKLTPKFLSLALTAFAATAFISCTNEMNDVNLSGSDAGALKLAKAAEVRAWSGSQDLSSFIGTRIEEEKGIKPEDVDFSKFENSPYKLDEGKTIEQLWEIDPWHSFPEEWQAYVPVKHEGRTDGNINAVSQEETDYVLDYIKTHQGYAQNTFSSHHYYIQAVGGSHDVYKVKNKDNADKELVSNTQMNKLQLSEKHVGDYNAINSGSRYLCLDWEITSASYQESTGSTVFSDAYKFFYIEYPKNSGNVHCYLGFDYKCLKTDEGINYEGDGIYNDWVIKLMPVDGKLVVPEGALPSKDDTSCNCTEDGGSCTCGENCQCPSCPDKQPENGCECTGTDDCECNPEDCECEDCECPECNPGEEGCNCDKDGCKCTDCSCQEGEDCGCPNCGESTDQGTGSGSGENAGNDKPGTQPNQPNNPSVPTGKTQSEVEVNLSMNDEHVDKQGNGINDLVAKLSIHVRHAGDVEIFIPVRAQYYCDNDDLIILQNHNPGNFVHGGTPVVDENGNPITDEEGKVINRQSLSYVIDGNAVTLYITYEDDGIRITTEGMNQAVFDYLRSEFGDGLNFEILLYFNDTITRDKLKEALNQSTIKFLDEKYPDYYINAFKDTVDNPNGEKDCYVTINEAQEGSYSQTPVIGNHLNASEYNQIYRRTGFDGPDGEHDHDFLWKYRK